MNVLGYANCWEDADVLCKALQPRPGMRVLSIASGGDNSFALAAAGAHVVAADFNAAQLACVELKRAAIRRLGYDDVLAFFGLRPSPDRRAIYQRLAPDLSGPARGYWDGHAPDIESGFVHSGKFERYLNGFRRFVMPLIHRPSVVRQLFEERSRSERKQFYDDVWDTVRWRALFRLYFSRTVMQRLGRKRSFFDQVDGAVADAFRARCRRALVDLPTHANPYLEYIGTGTFCRSMPRYLRPEHFEAVREGLDRLVLVEGPIEQAARTHAQDGFGGYNCSDLFEYVDEDTGRKLHDQLLGYAQPGACMAYWNMLVPRRFAADGHGPGVEQTERAQALHAEDLAFFYGAFILEEVGG